MPDYALYGGRLRSEIALPDLTSPAGPGAPDWTLRVQRAVGVDDAGADAELLGEEDIGGILVRHFKHGTGFRIWYDVVGWFDVLESGTQIVWYRPDRDVDIALVSLAVAGRVLATALHSAGALCLHGSAVAFGDRAVAFVAPKFHGKSTLALALMSSGAQLVTDDLIPVEMGPPVTVRPGAQNVRLFQDSFSTLAAAEATVARGPGGKLVLTELGEENLMMRRARLVAVHVLRPASELPGGAAVSRTPFAAVPAALQLVTHAKLGGVLGRSEGSVVFDRAARIARSVPVFELGVLRDYGRLPEVVAQVREWYAPEEASARGGRP